MILTLFIWVVYLWNTFNYLGRISISMNFHPVGGGQTEKRVSDLRIEYWPRCGELSPGVKRKSRDTAAPKSLTSTRRHAFALARFAFDSGLRESSANTFSLASCRSSTSPASHLLQKRNRNTFSIFAIFESFIGCVTQYVQMMQIDLYVMVFVVKRERVTLN